MRSSWIQFLLASIVLISTSSARDYAEQHLIASLLDDYPRTARPLINASHALVTNFRMHILSMDVNEKRQSLSILSWDTVEWIDQYLTWNPRDHSGIDETYIKEDSVWTPDIAHFNVAEEPNSKYNQAHARLSYDGSVVWTRTAKHKSPCTLNVANFPFDTHTCEMTFGSTIYHGNKINLNLGGVSLSGFASNVRWALKNADAERIVSKYPCCVEPYITLVFRFTFQRHATYYIYTLLIPTFLLSLFTLVLYLLPYHRPEKISLGLTLFGTFFILLIIMQYILPISESIPYFVYYLFFNLGLVALSTFLNTIIVNMASTDNMREVPRALRCIMEFFARLLCMSSIVRKMRSRHILTAEIGIPPLANNYYTLPLPDKKQQNTEPDVDSLCDEDQPESMTPRFVDLRRFESDVATIRTFAKRYQEKLTDEKDEKSQLSEWKDVARVTNRIFFVLCFLVDIGAMCAYLLLAIWPW